MFEVENKNLVLFSRLKYNKTCIRRKNEAKFTIFFQNYDGIIFSLSYTSQDQTVLNQLIIVLRLILAELDITHIQVLFLFGLNKSQKLQQWSNLIFPTFAYLGSFNFSYNIMFVFPFTDFVYKNYIIKKELQFQFSSCEKYVWLLLR